MSTANSKPAHTYLSTDLQALLEICRQTPNLLIIQDLDGVCMPLVSNPLQRHLLTEYIHACKALAGRFYVLTNGEHIGARGVNAIVERALTSSGLSTSEGYYLPGLAAGGVQLQDCYGQLSHPGVTPAELDFLATVPALISARLSAFLAGDPFCLDSATIDSLLEIVVLDNAVSPTLNIGHLFSLFKPSDAQDQSQPNYFQLIQNFAFQLMQQLADKAREQGLSDSFFIHLAPNLGTDLQGMERLKPSVGDDMGTTDFQFMLTGAIKEVGVLVLLNHFYFQQTGHYPLGADFNARTAPRDREALLSLAQAFFDPANMPTIIGVGDTITSSVCRDSKGELITRGGSDRGFLTLIQALGSQFNTSNHVVFVDSSGGELNRPGVDYLPPYTPQQPPDSIPVHWLKGITDSNDPLQINTICTGGHQHYVAFFVRLAKVLSQGLIQN